MTGEMINEEKLQKSTKQKVMGLYLPRRQDVRVENLDKLEARLHR